MELFACGLARLNMDKFIKRMASVVDADLSLCLNDGVAYQSDMSVSAAYDESYFNKCAGYEGQEIANRINAGRVQLVAEYFSPNAPMLDVGIGSGEFITSRLDAGGRTFGYDVNPAGEAWLRERSLWRENIKSFGALSFWDVIEHVPRPEDYFEQMRPGSFLFTSVPIFDDLTRIRESKHYRPGEHLYYWTRTGFISWMGWHGFVPIGHALFETEAGRDSIESFAFRLLG